MELETPWVEKYRPQTISDVSGHDEIKQRLEAYSRESSMPHLLFAGPAGTGKTTSALALAKQVFDGKMDGNFLELNASDERGIDVVRNNIKDFARTMSLGETPFKIIFLDEADALTNDAQNALRRTMERYTRTCRFILSCNYSSKIIDPLQSRCALFRFTRIPDKAISERLEMISKKEDVSFDSSGIEAVLYVADGDLRRAINVLQATAASAKNITEKDVFLVASRARPEMVRELMEKGISGDFSGARKMLDEFFITRSISGEEILLQMHKEIENLNIPNEKKLGMVKLIGEYNFRLVEGANEKIQLDALCAQMGTLRAL